MINRRAILRIGKTECDILRCGYTFKRDIDAKGRPQSGVRDGDIWVDFESEEDNILLVKMLLPKALPVTGSIEFWGLDDEKELRLLREIKFEKAWIYEQVETMSGYSFLPIITRIRIAPVRMDIGDRVKLDRRWPETSGFFWEKIEPKKIKVAQKSMENKVRITDAYWINEKGDKVRELITDNEVTLYIVLKDYTVGQTIDLTFEDSDDMGIYQVDCSGVVNEEGLLVIEDFKMKKQ